MNLTLPQQIEGILFYFGAEQSISDLAKLLSQRDEDIRVAVAELSNTLEDRGIQLSLQNDKVLLVTHPELSSLIKKVREEEQSGELSKAAQEVLSIVLYAGPISKAHVDYIRGVNSQVSVRNLLIRGLIERSATAPKHRTEYVVTNDFLNSLGVTNIEEVERYQEIRGELLASLTVNQEEK